MPGTCSAPDRARLTGVSTMAYSKDSGLLDRLIEEAFADSEIRGPIEEAGLNREHLKNRLVDRAVELWGKVVKPINEYEKIESQIEELQEINRDTERARRVLIISLVGYFILSLMILILSLMILSLVISPELLELG